MVGKMKRGKKYAPSYRIYATNETVTGPGFNVISFWHDIPISPTNGIYNFVCEIPKNTTAKMETSTTENFNPIRQDIKKAGVEGGGGQLRYYAMPIHWNYGMMPQTWEDPNHKWNFGGRHGLLPGDGDPLDVVEIGSGRATVCGNVYPVKVLGAFAMIDEGEVDWKVIAVRTTDDNADQLHDIADVDRVFPGELKRIHKWFRDYKVPDGKPQNKFAFGGKPLSREVTISVISETHRAWNQMNRDT